MNRGSLRAGAVALTLVSSLLALAPGLALAYDGHTAQGQPCWATSGTINGVYHATELGCVKDGSSPRPQPTAAPVRPVQAQPVAPVQAEPVTPVQSQPVDAVPSQPALAAPSTCTPVDPSAFQHAYKTNVAGAAYTLDDLANDQRLLYTDPGAISGGLQIYPDGTYAWTTQHSGAMSGNWVVDPTRACGAITLLQGDSGEDWTVELYGSGSDGQIAVFDTYGVFFIGYPLDS